MQNVVLKVSPDPPVKGQPLSITVSGTLDQDFGAGSADVELDVKALGIINKQVKVSSPFTFAPAFKQGPQSLTVGPFTLPSLPGSVSAKGTVKLVNDKSEPVTCVNVNLDMPAMEAANLTAGPGSEQVAVEASCAKSTDHLKNIQVSNSGGVTTVTGSLDEAVTKATAHVDLTVHEIFGIPVKLDIPVALSPGLPSGDLKITAGPVKFGEMKAEMPLVSVTGTVTIDDGNNQEITCISVGSSADVKVDAPVVV